MDRKELGEMGVMGETGGVGGSRNVSPTGALTGGFITAPLDVGTCDSGGVEGGVRTLARDTWLVGSCAVGALYVIPMAPCRPARSRFWGMKATVISPSRPLPGCKAGTGIRTTDSLPVTRGSSHRGMARIFFLSKCFQLLMRRADAGSARIRVFPFAGNWRNVASWQWSGL